MSFLSAKQTTVFRHFDTSNDGLITAPQESNRLIEQLEIEESPPIIQEGGDRASEPLTVFFPILPPVDVHAELVAPLRCQLRGYVAVLDTFRTQVEHLAVVQASQQKIVQRLSLMGRGQCLSTLQFLDHGPVDQHVDAIGFRKSSISHGDPELYSCGLHCTFSPAEQFVLIDFLITQTPQFIVGLEDEAREDFVNDMKLVLQYPDHGEFQFYWHIADPLLPIILSIIILTHTPVCIHFAGRVDD